MNETNVTPIATASSDSDKVSLATGSSLRPPCPCRLSSACKMS